MLPYSSPSPGKNYINTDIKLSKKIVLIIYTVYIYIYTHTVQCDVFKLWVFHKDKNEKP